MKRSVAVVGGGITGLSLAWFLQRRGAQVTLFEAGAGLGGLAIAADFGAFTWDRFYHVIAPGDRELLAWLDQLGLGDEVRWTPSRQGVYLDGAVRPLNGALDLLRLPGLTFADKVRLGLLAFRARAGADPAALDRTTSADWLRARCGQRAFDRLWRHLLRAKLGGAAEQVSARFIHATLRRLLTARRRTGGGERFGCVRGGYAAVLARCAERLQAAGAVLRPGAAVQLVACPVADRPVTVGHAAGAEAFDRAVVTLPNPLLADVVADLPAAEADRLANTPYLGVACTVAVGRAPLGPNYILNLCDDRLGLTGIVEASNVIGRDQTAGHALVYLPRYALADDPLLTRPDDDALRTAALADLRAVFPAADERWLVRTAVHRARWIQPVPLCGAPPVAPPRTVVPGRVFCVSSAQLPACVLNNNDCVALARAAAAEVLAG